MAGVCPEDPEAFLCDEESAAHDVAAFPSFNVGQQLVLLSALALRSDSAATAFVVLPFLALPGAKAAVWTCGDFKTAFKGALCCGEANTMEVSWNIQSALCPYNFTKPGCDIAAPQAPRDLTTDNNGEFVQGELVPKSPTLSPEQVVNLSYVNVHFHEGAEHKADEYKNAAAIDAWDSSSGTTRPGYMCDYTASSSTTHTWQWCKEVEIGKSYEVHFVHSSAGYSPEHTAHSSTDELQDGLGGAAHGLGILNPTVAVEAQVFHIVPNDEPNVDAHEDIVYGWPAEERHAVSYMGSTTGPSHDNTHCSPYVVTWHVDLKCHKIRAEDFDKMCKAMKDTYKMENDLHPHGSRGIVDPAYVVKSEYIKNITSELPPHQKPSERGPPTMPTLGR